MWNAEDVLVTHYFQDCALKKSYSLWFLLVALDSLLYYGTPSLCSHTFIFLCVQLVDRVTFRGRVSMHRWPTGQSSFRNLVKVFCFVRCFFKGNLSLGETRIVERPRGCLSVPKGGIDGPRWCQPLKLCKCIGFYALFNCGLIIAMWIYGLNLSTFVPGIRGFDIYISQKLFSSCTLFF